MTYCGLDFGTSNSAIGVSYQGKLQLCPLENDQITMPTALFYHENSGKCTFGREAVSDYLEGDAGRLMRSIKSILGTSLMDETTSIRNESYSFKSILSDYIAMLKHRAEKWAGTTIDQVVQGRPVRFVEGRGNENQEAEDALREILLDVGFKDISFQFEPLAAAHCLAQDEKGAGLALVVDMGGGTTDFTLLDLDSVTPNGNLTEKSVLANHGIRLGGVNFDKSISLSKVMPSLGYRTKLKGDSGLITPNWVYQMLTTWSEINFLYAPKHRSDLKWIIRNGAETEQMERLEYVLHEQVGHEICHNVELAKINLSLEDIHQIDLSYVDRDLKIPMTAKELPEVLAVDLSSFKSSIVETLRLANVTTNQIGTICLTGGSTNLLPVQQLIKDLFPTAIMIEQDKFSSVCRGLTIDAQGQFA